MSLRVLAVALLALGLVVEARDAEVVEASEGVSQAAVEVAQPEELFLSSRRRAISGGYSGGGYNSGGFGNTGGRSHTTYTHTTAGDEVKSAFNSAVLGFFLFIFAFPVLWFNEGREAHMWVLFGKAGQIMRSVSESNVNPSDEAALVHVAGVTSTDEQLQDSAFPVRVLNCTKLCRTVSMYQWAEQTTEESRDNAQGGKDTITTYNYVQEWSQFAIDSNSFNDTNYRNPPMPFESATKVASVVNLGAYQLSKRLVEKTCKTQSASGSELGDMRGFSKMGNGYTNVGVGQPPVIGSLRVEFAKTECGDTAVLAVQHNNSFAPLTYSMNVENGKVVSPDGNTAPLLDAADKSDMELGKAPTGCLSLIGKGCSCIGTCIQSRQEVYELAEEKISGSELLDRAVAGQECIHKVLKVVGFLMLLLGLDSMTTFLPTLFRFIPFLGTWVQWILNGAAHLFSFLMAGFFFLVTVAIAWLRYRPMKAMLLLTVAAACLAATFYFAQNS